MGESLLECRGLVIMITVIVVSFGAIFGVFMWLGIYEMQIINEGYTITSGTCYTWSKEVDSYYDSTAEMWQFRAQWEVDIADNTTGLWYYSRVCLADTGESVWTTSENKAENQLDMWALGQNTCWFNVQCGLAAPHCHWRIMHSSGMTLMTWTPMTHSWVYCALWLPACPLSP